MKRGFLCSLIATVLFTGSGWAIDVIGNVSGVWNAAGSPYRVLGHVSVPEGQVLQIEPGVRIEFIGHYKLNVFGTLLALGTEADSILFTRAEPTEESKWWGIRFSWANPSSRLEYCIIEYGKANGGDLENIGGGAFCYASAPLFRHCTIRNNWAQHGGGVACDNGYDGTTPRFEYCVITGNTAQYGGGINCWHTSAVFTHCTISDNLGSINGGALRIGQSTARFINTIFSFTQNGTGVTFAAGSPYGQFDHCDFFGNGSGNFAGAVPNGLGLISGTNANGDPCDQNFNILLDPMFVNHESGDFRLTEHSPCINAGNPTLPHDPDGSVSDIGAYSFPFHQPPDHHFAAVPPTGLPYAIVVDSAIIDGVPLHAGDEIAVFDGNLCVGVSPVIEWPVSLTAWQGDPGHGLAGFTVGHPMLFRVWLRDNDVDLPAAADIILGDGNFGTGVYSRINLSGSATAIIGIPLRANYANMVSLNVRPAEPTADHIFGNLGSLIAGYEDNGHVFIPPDLNTIGELRITAGFRLYCSDPETLVVAGLPMNPMTEYVLHAGLWNWIGYPLAVSAPVHTALAAITEHLLVIQNDDGEAWIPRESVNTLGVLEPGRGYMVLVDQDVVFRYDLSETCSFGTGWGNTMTSPTTVIPTGLPYISIVQMTDELSRLAPRHIELYDGDCCVGDAIITDPTDKYPIAAWQGIADLGLSGYTPGHSIKIVVRDASGMEIPSTGISAAQTFGSGGYATLLIDAATGDVAIANKFTVSEGYPNPFNPQVTIPFVMPETGALQIRIFNTLGQTIFESREIYPAGANRFVFDVNSASSHPVSGLYFVRFEFAGKTETRKVMLLR